MTIRVNRSTTLFKTGLFQLISDNVTLPNGEITDILVLRHPGAAAIIPITDQDEVILIRQYRHALGLVIWEIPAGTRQPDEDPLICARRELNEETGFSARTWNELGVTTPVPGYSDEQIHLFIAKDLIPGHQNLDRDELVEVRKVQWENALEMIFDGTIRDGKTITGLLLADAWLKRSRHG